MPFDHVRFNGITILSEQEARAIDQLKARIAVWKRIDDQAIARGKAERAKWLLSNNKTKNE